MPRSLPINPSISFLQAEAKSVLKAHRNGDLSICPTYRLLKRFSGLSDQEILQSRISLQATQFALALDYGFKDWKELKAHVESLQEEQGQASKITGPPRLYLPLMALEDLGQHPKGTQGHALKQQGNLHISLILSFKAARMFMDTFTIPECRPTLGCC